MSKTFSVTLGGKEWPLKFGTDEARTLKRSFPDTVKAKGLHGLLMEDALGFEPKASAQGQEVYEFANRFDPDVRHAVLFLAIHKANPKMTEKYLSDLLDEYLAAEGNMLNLVSVAVRCAFYSGAINGRQTDLELEAQETARELGKEMPPEPRPEPIPAAQ